MSGDPGSTSLGGQIILIVILTAVNAIFAAAEMAIVSVNRPRIEAEAKNGDKKAVKLLEVMNNSSQFLATIQVAITFAGFLSSASAATSMASRLAPLFGDVSWGEEASTVIITLALSYISLVFGELFPKQVALANPESIAKQTVGIVRAVSVFTKPFVWLLSASTSLLTKLTGQKLRHEEDNMTREEMLQVIEKSRKTGLIRPDEYQMLEGIITFNDKMAREVMVPRTDMFMIDIEDNDQENIDEVLNMPYSRVPVYRGDKDEVVGVIHIKQLLKRARQVGFDHLQIADVMSQPLFVPETVTIDDLLREMQKTQQQMAILLDEYGGVVGLATIEDLLEEIVGDIDDESDHVTTLYHKLNDYEFAVSGKMPISDFNDEFGTDLAADDVDTIAGYVISKLGMIPENGHPKHLLLECGLELVTGHMDGSRLEDLYLKLPQLPKPAANLPVNAAEPADKESNTNNSHPTVNAG
jgi:putative hemolysin